MESQKPRIELYVKRPFSEKLNASFDFIKENWKPIIKFVTYLLLPLSLIQALSLNGFMGSYMGVVSQASQGDSDSILSALPTLGLSYSVLLLCSWLGSVVLVSLIYALMMTYRKREGRLEGITLGELRPLLLHNVVAMIKLTLFFFVLMMVALCLLVGLVVVTPFTLILTIPLLVACAVPLSLWAPVYLFEEISLIGALKKTFRLGFATWGGVFLITLIMGIIASILQGVAGIPWSVAFMVKSLFSLSEGGDIAGSSVGYTFLLYLFGILQCFGIYLSAVFTILGITYQYGHASEVVDSVSVEDDIEHFDTL